MHKKQMPNTYFNEAAEKDSEEILTTVSKNLNRCLTARGVSKVEFIEWLTLQGHPNKLDHIRRWSGFPSKLPQKKVVKTVELRDICLMAAYMRHKVRDVMFTDIPMDRF
jgi:hypothetical protein